METTISKYPRTKRSAISCIELFLLPKLFFQLGFNNNAKRLVGKVYYNNCQVSMMYSWELPLKHPQAFILGCFRASLNVGSNDF